MSSETEKPEKTKSLRISPPGTPTRVRFYYGVGIFWLIVAGFIASPFRELWPFILPSGIPVSIGLVAARSTNQKLVGIILILFVFSTALLSMLSK